MKRTNMTQWKLKCYFLLRLCPGAATCSASSKALMPDCDWLQTSCDVTKTWGRTHLNKPQQQKIHKCSLSEGEHIVPRIHILVLSFPPTSCIYNILFIIQYLSQYSTSCMYSNQFIIHIHSRILHYSVFLRLYMYIYIFFIFIFFFYICTCSN